MIKLEWYVPKFCDCTSPAWNETKWRHDAHGVRKHTDKDWKNLPKLAAGALEGLIKDDLQLYAIGSERFWGEVRKIETQYNFTMSCRMPTQYKVPKRRHIPSQGRATSRRRGPR